MVAHKIPCRFFKLVPLSLPIVVFLLVLVMFMPKVNNASRWLWGFQPSELAKLTLIIVVSDLFSRIKTMDDQRKYFCIAMGITLLICGIIFIGNLSTAVLLGGIVILLAILARVHIKYWGSSTRSVASLHISKSRTVCCARATRLNSSTPARSMMPMKWVRLN
mgnify:CR=1 FL=1